VRRLALRTGMSFLLWIYKYKEMQIEGNLHFPTCPSQVGCLLILLAIS
jgi:hypothetical protein